MNHNPVNLLSNSYSTHPTVVHINLPIHHQVHHHHQKHRIRIFCSLRRHHRRRRRNPERPTHTKPSSDEKLQMVINMGNEGPLSMKRLLKLDEFLHSGNEAFKDLQTLVTIDTDHKVIISCQRSTVQFVANLLLWGLLFGFAFRVLVKLGLGFRNHLLGFGYSGGSVVRRRDRSLGGREVVVGKRENRMSEFRVSVNPPVSKGMPKNRAPRKDQKLPNWWPLSLPPPLVMVDKLEYQRKANGLIRAIMDYRMSGKDILEDDIIQLRRVCRTSGVRVFIEPTNARDSFYRVSVDFVLNICGSVASQSEFVQIDGESAREFIAGLADNIGLENIRAARMVAAAVAARTRSWLLQAWALNMQGKHSEAVVELSKLCLTHQTFPPEEYSPEMEMVAGGLEKHLKVEQREYLIKMVVEVCSDEESRRSVAEALGLSPSPEIVGDQQGN